MNEGKSEQAHIPHAPTLLENAVYNEKQFQALVTGNRTKKGIWVIVPQKDQISISCKNAYLHIMSFITTKFHAILLSGFSEVVLTNCFSSIFLTRKTGLTDWLTDWLTDGSKTFYPPQLVAWGIISHGFSIFHVLHEHLHLPVLWPPSITYDSVTLVCNTLNFKKKTN